MDVQAQIHVIYKYRVLRRVFHLTLDKWHRLIFSCYYKDLQAKAYEHDEVSLKIILISVKQMTEQWNITQYFPQRNTNPINTSKTDTDICPACNPGIS